MHTAHSALSEFREEGVHVSLACAEQDFSVCHLVLPGDVENTPEAPEVKGVQPFLSTCVTSPCLTGVQQCVSHHYGFEPGK